MGRFHGWLGVLAALIFVGAMVAVPAAAQAATLKADYELQGTYSSSLGGGGGGGGASDLTDIGAGNAFATETVNGVSRQVLTFPQDNGLDLATSGLVGFDNYSVVVVFRFADVSAYRRILDFSNGTSDDGLYDYNGLLDIYQAGGNQSATTLFSNDTYAEVALTDRDRPTSTSDVTAYVNGTQAQEIIAMDNFKSFAGHIRFFKDDGSVEESAGAVACIRIYDGLLTGAEVAQMYAEKPLCTAVATAPGPGGGGGATSDTVPPNTKLKKKPAKRTGDDTPTFKFSSTEPGSSFKCRIDRKKFKPCHSPFTTKPLHSGRHTFRVDAVDPAGNADPTPAKFKFTVL